MPPAALRTATRVLIAVLAAALALELGATPSIVVAAAMGPTLVWLALVLALGRVPSRTWDALLLAFLGGAVVAAAFAEAGNHRLTDWAVRVLGLERGRALVPTTAGPLVEESVKALVLFLVVALRREAFRGPRQGAVWGALVGLGFSFDENLRYFTIAAVQGGLAALRQSLVVRGGLSGLNHAVFTAATGVGLGWAILLRSRRLQLAAGTGGLCAAMAQHVLWNAAASLLVMRALCGRDFPAVACQPPPEGPSLTTVALVTTAFLGPGALILCLAVRAAAPRDP